MNRELLDRVVEGAKRVARLLLSNVNKGLLDRIVKGVKDAFSLSMLKRLLFYTACCFVLYSIAGVSGYLIFNDNLPDFDAWSFQPKRVTNVYSADGRHLQDFLEENREIVTYKEIPASMQAALLAAEDRRFFFSLGYRYIPHPRIAAGQSQRPAPRRPRGQYAYPTARPQYLRRSWHSAQQALPLRMWRPHTHVKSANRLPPS